MRLSDVVSGSGLAFWAEAGLVIFFVVFVAVTIRALRQPRESARRHASLPLEDTWREETR